MRKFTKKTIGIIVCLSLIFTLNGPFGTQSADAMAAIAETNITNDVYEYPVYPGDSEWAEYNAQELTKMLQIPEDVLKRLTTEELVKVVADYPYLSDMFYYDSYKAGFEAVRGSFNGLDELMKRQDASECLLEYYKKIDFSKPVDLQSPKNVVRASNCNVIEVILAQADVVSSRSNIKSMEVERAIEKNVQYRMDNRDSAFYRRTNCYYKALEENQLQRSSSSSTVRTPNGTLVDVITISDEWTAMQKYAERMSILSEYPNVTILSEATKKYNCHAYAWATRTNVWMNDPSAYWRDGSYIRSGDSVTAYTQKVAYPSMSSSGISHTAHSSSNDGSVMWSKWGSSCLVEHSVYDCPYGRALTPPYTIVVYTRA